MAAAAPRRAWPKRPSLPGALARWALRLHHAEARARLASWFKLQLIDTVDKSVIAARARWPNVPAVYGWLQLTARGQWRIRGEAIGNAAIRAFIDRNYACDERGCWFFQNGPQRVFVALEATPWVYRFEGDAKLVTHSGVVPARCLAAALLDDGRIVLDTELGAGLLDDRDNARLGVALTDAADALLAESAIDAWLAGAQSAFITPSRLGLPGPPVRIERLRADQIEARFGFVREPAP